MRDVVRVLRIMRRSSVTPSSEDLGNVENRAIFYIYGSIHLTLITSKVDIDHHRMGVACREPPRIGNATQDYPSLDTRTWLGTLR
jgi:hypothetical protein